MSPRRGGGGMQYITERMNSIRATDALDAVLGTCMMYLYLLGSEAKGFYDSTPLTGLDSLDPVEAANSGLVPKPMLQF